jgi:hypothetical protein
MKHLKSLCWAALCGAALLVATTSNSADNKAPDVKTYQVTGPVLALTASSVVVQKGKDEWELARTSSTKVTGDLKVGSKVTIQYRMIAAEIEVKDAKKK